VGIDTANQRRHYVEADVGHAVAEALAADDLSREDLFLQTKFTYVRGQDHRLPYDPRADFPTQVAQSFASSLEHLQTSYIDSYLLHGPSRGYGLGDADWQVWSAMESLQQAGKARLIGVSNVSLEQLAALVREAEVKPAFVQNRCFARDAWDYEVRAFCRDNDIVYQGFSLLTANQRELVDPAVQRIVAKTGGTLPQVVFRFAIQLGMVPLTGTTDATHMQQDLSCGALELADEDVQIIERIGV